MADVTLNHGLILAGVLFSIGFAGLLPLADFLKVDQCSCAPYRFGIVAAIEKKLGHIAIRHGLYRNHVFHANDVRLAADGMCNLVDGALNGEAGGRPGHPAVSTNR